MPNCEISMWVLLTWLSARMIYVLYCWGISPTPTQSFFFFFYHPDSWPPWDGQLSPATIILLWYFCLASDLIAIQQAKHACPKSLKLQAKINALPLGGSFQISFSLLRRLLGFLSILISLCFCIVYSYYRQPLSPLTPTLCVANTLSLFSTGTFLVGTSVWIRYTAMRLGLVSWRCCFQGSGYSTSLYWNFTLLKISYLIISGPASKEKLL